MTHVRQAVEKPRQEETTRHSLACFAARSAALDLAGVPAKLEHGGQKKKLKSMLLVSNSERATELDRPCGHFRTRAPDFLDESCSVNYRSTRSIMLTINARSRGCGATMP